MLSALLLGLVSTALLGRVLSGQLGAFAVHGRLSYVQDGARGTESHDRRSGQCGEVLHDGARDVIPSELTNTNVGAMLGRGDEEDILKPLTICENYQPRNRRSKSALAD